MRKTKLTLGRRPGESVVVDVPGAGEMCVIVNQCRAGKVSLTFHLPEDWGVLRGEIDPKRTNNPEQVPS